MIRVWANATNNFPLLKNTITPAGDVSVALSIFDPIWKELVQAALERPHFQFPLHYDEFYGCLLPHLSHIKSIHQYGKLRATAELHSGNPQDGTQSIRFMLQMVDRIQSEAFIISYLVRIADFQITMHPLWEGITHHLFRKEGLEILAHQLSQMSFIPQLQRALGMERAIHVAEILRVTKHRAYFARISNTSNMEAQDWPFPWTYHSYPYLAPKGWIKRNLLAYSKDLISLEKNLASWQKSKADVLRDFKQSTSERPIRPVTVYNVLSRSWTFNDRNIFAKALRAEAMVRLARTALALEQFYLDQSTYPASLYQLVPQFLPEVELDPIDFEPMRYQRTKADQFRLYSIGWNETDDGGKFEKEYKQGDWLWKWPVDSKTE